ncbi:LacI family DNA-binding transcriptional regulator [Ruficoccus amylovorans]|uniref:LacI family DNA-binding transcriptional regulator n=2 Tax=Ruficoccus amylovorans TaxID=1804625 RepID=A0A842H9P4_9BACT|nr:LacI family DNA-binding transcriptional regulator [Ruficoccus amylovorans]
MCASKKNVGLKDIAEATGYSRITVSCALRSSPKVKASTAAIIRKKASELGYVPDPRVSAVMASVRAAKKRYQEPLAWLNASPERWYWRDYKWLTPYMEGAQKECAALGYRLDDFWLYEPGMTEKRMSQILINRGIRGVIITPAPTILGVSHLAFDWERLCGITFESALHSPRLHRVAPSYHYNLMLALKVLRLNGYRRIGLFMHNLENRRSQNTYLAALHYFQKDLPKHEQVRPLTFKSIWGLPNEIQFSKWAAEESQKPDQGNLRAKPLGMLRDWIAKEHPDAIVVQNQSIIEWLIELGLCVPNDIGVAHLALDDDCADWAGIWQNKRHIGAQAVRELITMLQTNQIGPPEIFHETLIRGNWRYGKTIKSR